MKDPQDKQTADMLRSANAERQARLKAKREAAGFRHSTIWIHTESEQAGAEAAAKGEPCAPDQPPRDLVSWVVGWARKKESEK